MRQRIVFAILIGLIALAPRAHAQGPTISEVSGQIAEPARSQLTRQRADLLAQREAIAAKVRAHNDTCGGNVPEGGAAEAKCAASQKQLNAVIKDYRTAVEAFNAAVVSAARGK